MTHSTKISHVFEDFISENFFPIPFHEMIITELNSLNLRRYFLIDFFYNVEFFSGYRFPLLQKRYAYKI